MATNGHINLLLYANSTWTNTDISYVAGASNAIPANTQGGLGEYPAQYLSAENGLVNFETAYFLQSDNGQLDYIDLRSPSYPPWYASFLYTNPSGNPVPVPRANSPLTAFVGQ